MLFRQFPHQKTNKTHRNIKKQHEHETKDRFSAIIHISLEVGLGFWKQASTARQSDAGDSTEAAKISVADKNHGVVHGKKKHVTHRKHKHRWQIPYQFLHQIFIRKKRTVSYGLFMAMPWQKPHLGHSAIRKINATWLHSGRQQNEFIARSIQISVFLFPQLRKSKQLKQCGKSSPPDKFLCQSNQWFFFGERTSFAKCWGHVFCAGTQAKDWLHRWGECIVGIRSWDLIKQTFRKHIFLQSFFLPSMQSWQVKVKGRDPIRKMGWQLLGVKAFKDISKLLFKDFFCLWIAGILLGSLAACP